ncbi:MAG: hypothetical protein JST16_04565 [Bdellovibrionales bacterium]|nr:hypothetical protein [Bdellovibrionales bacterium]
MQVGYFEGALERALRLERHAEFGRSARFTAWMARVYLGEDHWAEAWAMKDVLKEIKTLSGGQGFGEYVCVGMMSNHDSAAVGIGEMLKIADAQHGVLVLWHPSAIVQLAEFSLRQLRDERTAILLINIALGFRNVFAVLSDLQRLAKLLVELNAPVCIWADWCSAFIQHVQFATNRVSLLRERLHQPRDAERWSLAQDAASEDVARSVIGDAPAEAWVFLISLALHLDAAALGQVVKDSFKPGSVAGSRGADPIWSAPAVLRYRYFWYDMITPEEQALVRNGDWAMFGVPTDDFSMGLAQWWRAIESVLKRSVVTNLSSALATQPHLVSMDRENLSAAKTKEEALFLEKLVVPDRAAKMTLYDILLLLKKCEATNEKGTAGSRVRFEAARILKRYSAQIGPLTKGSLFSPVHLTDENINWFRNRSSHDASVPLEDAGIGRVLARRILSGFFVPVLNSWGFNRVLL